MIIYEGEGDYTLTYQIQLMGKDVQIIVYGGDAHIGSVTVAEKGEVTTWNGKGHQDDKLSESLAKEISLRYDCTCLVAAGFHQDNITSQGILQVLKNHKNALGKVLSWLDEIYI